MASDCLFCKIVAGEIPATKLLDTPDCIAFKDINPQAPVHIVVIPRKHIATLNDADDPAILGSVVMGAARVAKEAGLAENGWRLVVNTNKDAGQTVFHIHAHVLGGRHLHWPPG